MRTGQHYSSASHAAPRRHGHPNAIKTILATRRLELSTNFYTRDLVGVGLTSNFAVDRWPAQDQPEKRLHSRSTLSACLRSRYRLRAVQRPGIARREILCRQFEAPAQVEDKDAGKEKTGRNP